MDVEPMQALAIRSMAMFAPLLPLTPGSFGVREGIISLTSHLCGLPADQAMLAAIVYRGVAMATTLAWGVLGNWMLARHIDHQCTSKASREED
jgi:uncharacterized membrane protein YbhN (UPF0104 family)